MCHSSSDSARLQRINMLKTWLFRQGDSTFYSSWIMVFFNYWVQFENKCIFVFYWTQCSRPQSAPFYLFTFVCLHSCKGTLDLVVYYNRARFERKNPKRRQHPLTTTKKSINHYWQHLSQTKRKLNQQNLPTSS